MSTYNSGTQWDLPFGWAPPSWMPLPVSKKVGDLQDARRISEKFSHTIQSNLIANTLSARNTMWLMDRLN